MKPITPLLSLVAIAPWLISSSSAAGNFPIVPRIISRSNGNDSGSSRRSFAVPAAALLRAGDSSSDHSDSNSDDPLRQLRGGNDHLATEPPPLPTTITPTAADDNGGQVASSDTESEGAHVEIAKKLGNRNRTNLSRKFTHAAFGIFFACLNQFLPRSKFVPGMSVLTGATLLMELLRYHRGFRWMNSILHFFLGGALRKHEMEGKFTGSFYYFSGVLASAYLFPQTAATMGICQLALADPSASYFGRKTRHVYWSRIENGLAGFGRNKGLLGFLGGACFCFPFNYRVLKIAKWGAKGVPGGEVSIVAVSMLLGLAGAFADLAVPTPALTMPPKVLGVPMPRIHVDDNFVVPIFSGWACTKIFAMVGWSDGLELAKHIIF